MDYTKPYNKYIEKNKSDSLVAIQNEEKKTLIIYFF